MAQAPDPATPLSSNGGYGNASGKFNWKRHLERGATSRSDLDKQVKEHGEQNPMTTTSGSENNATDRYFGSFSIEAKRNVRDLLRNHPKFGDSGRIRMNRIENNTREVMPNDPFIDVRNGGYVVTEKP